MKKYLFLILLSCFINSILKSQVLINGINYLFSENSAEVMSKYPFYSGAVNIPSTVIYNGKPYPVIGIYSSAFAYCKDVTSITIPNSVTKIGEWAFRECKGLTSITLPNSVTSMDNSIFLDCRNLYLVHLPDDLRKITSSTFKNCINLTSINIPDSVIIIEPEAFQNCNSLMSIDLPNSITSIGRYAFYDCGSLLSVFIPSSVLNIEGNAFGGYYSALNTITVDENNIVYASENGMLFNKNKTELIRCPRQKQGELVISNLIENIADEAFADCSNLTSLLIPNSVVNIGKSAFSNCNQLYSISFPNSLKNIGELALEWTPWLYSQPEGIVYAGNAMYEYKGYMPENTDIVLKEGIENIPFSFFSEAENLKSITLPKSLTSIKGNAFYGCSNLSEIHSRNPIPPQINTNLYSFYGVPEACKIYVPKGSYVVYSQAEGWRNFTNIIEKDYNFMDVANIDGISIYNISNGICIETIEPINVAIFSIYGQKLYKSIINSNTDIDLSKGIYIVTINDRVYKINNSFK